MANQYFENNPDLKTEIKKIEYFYKQITITFFSDYGVFSKTGIDFGSNLLLKTIEIKNAKKVLDVGCGYGTIGLTISKAYPDTMVTMVDVNLRALTLAKKGIEANLLKNALVIESDAYQNIHDTFDIIVTNPPIRAGKRVVHKILLDGVKYLHDGGCLWCVIQKKQGAPSAFKALMTVYKKVEIVEKDNGYWIIKAVK